MCCGKGTLLPLSGNTSRIGQSPRHHKHEARGGSNKCQAECTEGWSERVYRAGTGKLPWKSVSVETSFDQICLES